MNTGERRGEKEREANHKRLLTTENKLKADGRRGGGWAKWVRSFLLSLLSERASERERARARGRGRGREKSPSRLCTVSTEPKVGLELMNHEIMT